MPRRQRDEERDWRATLFVWRGVLDVSRSGAGLPCVTWGGVWVPTDTDTLPDSGDKRYEDSQNEFTLRSRNYVEQDAIEILESCVEPADMEDLGELFWGLEHLGDIRLTGSYQLDQCDGRGHHAYTDDWHDMAVSIRGQYAVVAACGDTQFGRFVSLGYVDGQEMVLATICGRHTQERPAHARTSRTADRGILVTAESFDPGVVALPGKPWRAGVFKRGPWRACWPPARHNPREQNPCLYHSSLQQHR